MDILGMGACYTIAENPGDRVYLPSCSGSRMIEQSIYHSISRDVDIALSRQC